MAKIEIRAPLPGIFFRRPAPDKPNYKEPGDRVAKGDAIGLIEVMKSYNEVQSDVDGVIISFLAENEEPIMPGQPLVEIEG